MTYIIKIFYRRINGGVKARKRAAVLVRMVVAYTRWWQCSTEKVTRLWI